MPSAERRPIVPPGLAILVGIFAVSTGSILVRNAQVYAPSIVVAAYRLTLATVLLTPLALLRHKEELRQLSRAEISLAALSGFFLSLHFATWITSLQYTTVASSVVLVSTSPLWVALLSPLVLKEPLTRPVQAGMGLALAGTLVVGLSDSCTWTGAGLDCPAYHEIVRGEAFVGDVLALIGAWMAAGYLLIGRRLRAGISLVSYVFVVYGVAAGFLVVFMLAAGQFPFGYPPQAYVWFLLLALVPQLIGHSTFNWALGYLPAAFVSISLLGEPIGSAILAYFLLQETPSGLKVIGAILILAGITIASRSERGARDGLESREQVEALGRE